MIITLEYDEIKKALLKAVEEKTQCIHGEAKDDNSYFVVELFGGKKEGKDIENVTFSVIFDK